MLFREIRFSYLLLVVNRILQRYFRIPSGSQAAAHTAKQGFNQIQLIETPIFVDIPAQNRHYGYAQGGDRYPENGADHSDRVLPQNRRRKRRTGKAGIRCPCRSSKPAAEVAELPHKPKAGTSGCSHRNRKGTKQGTDFSLSLFPAFLCPALEILFPYPNFSGMPVHAGLAHPGGIDWIDPESLSPALDKTVPAEPPVHSGFHRSYTAAVGRILPAVKVVSVRIAFSTQRAA